MSEIQTKKYEDPTGRAVGIFATHEAAEAARASLIKDGLDPSNVFLLFGVADAARINESPKWFADTDETLKRLKRDLENGHALVSAEADNNETLDAIRDIYKRAGALQMTHFGTWLTQSEDLDV